MLDRVCGAAVVRWRLDLVLVDGLSDLAQVRFNAVDVWLNLGGVAWSDRIILDGVPYHPGIVNRIRAADVNGSSTTVGGHRPFRRRIRPGRGRSCSRG